MMNYSSFNSLHNYISVVYRDLFYTKLSKAVHFYYIFHINKGAFQSYYLKVIWVYYIDLGNYMVNILSRKFYF